MIHLDVGCPMLGFDQSFTMFFSCISLSSSKLCFFRKTYTAKQPRWRSSKRVATSERCRRNWGFSPPKVELWAPTCNWFLGPPCTRQLAHMIWWKWGIGVAKRLTLHNCSLHFSMLATEIAKRLTLHNCSLHFSMLATEILGRQLMHLLYPSIYFVGISLRFFIGFRWKKYGSFWPQAPPNLFRRTEVINSASRDRNLSLPDPVVQRNSSSWCWVRPGGGTLKEKWVGTNIK